MDGDKGKETKGDGALLVVHMNFVLRVISKTFETILAVACYLSRHVIPETLR